VLNVTVSAMSHSGHLTQVLSGLYALEARGEVDLKFAADSSFDWPEHLLVATVFDDESGESRRICFDLRDGQIVDRMVLPRVDVYFKRTYRNAEMLALPDDERAKIRPYGLNYACATDQLRSVAFVQQLLVERASRSNGGVATAARRAAGHVLRKMGMPARAAVADTPLPYESYEASADDAAAPRVIFLTRLWDPAQGATCGAEDRRQLNETRARVVRTLRKRLGDRFIGGVKRDAFAEANYSDCVVDDGAIKTNYIDLMKRQLVGVSTTGLHGSTGWKLAEYVAAARCIVSEPVAPESCCGFAAGLNFLEFETAEQCADACERLLDDVALATAMRRRNEAYYRAELEPPTMIAKHLARALAR
jgi:hypothetical protein